MNLWENTNTVKYSQVFHKIVMSIIHLSVDFKKLNLFLTRKMQQILNLFKS